jgi:beta-N-acetylhexosaminidase
MIAGVDSVAHLSQVLVVDVPDPGMRTAAAPYVLLAALRAATRARVPVVVLDRPNPLGGDRVEGPTPAPDGGTPDAVYGFPARHGMTAGELAAWFNERAAIGAALEVVPVRGWRRAGDVARDRDAVTGVTGEPATRDQLALLAAFAPASATALHVMPGPGRAEIRVAAPWLDARAVADAVADRLIPGTRIRAASAEVDGRAMPALVIERRDRDAAPALRTMLAVLVEVRRRAPTQLAIRAQEFDRLAAGAGIREAIERGDDSDAAADRTLGPALDFRTATQRFRRYR